MSAWKRNFKPVPEDNTGKLHPDHETRDTRVSDYLRKFGTGKIDELPKDGRTRVSDSRSVDEMLADVDKLTDSLATEQLDVMIEIQSRSADFESAFKEIELTKKQKSEFENAIRVLNDKNSSYDDTLSAYRILEQLEREHKVTRARN